MNVLRTCGKCCKQKPETEFPFCKKRSEGRQAICAACAKAARSHAYYKGHRQACIERSLAWVAANREKVLVARREWRKANPEKSSEEWRRRQSRMSDAERARRTERSARYYAQNREAVLAQQKQKNLQQPEKNREKVRRWYVKNPDRTYERARIWKAEHPRAARVLRSSYRQKRRARNSASGKPDPAHMEQLLRQTSCSYCGRAFDPSVRALWLTVDHVVPLCLGGTNESGNLIAACYSCNRSKGGQLLAEWRKNPRPGWTPVKPPDTGPLPEGGNPERPSEVEHEQTSQ